MKSKSLVTTLLTLVLTVVCLSGLAQADPIKVQPVAVTASNTYSGSSPNFAVDGSSSTSWNSGKFPTQWIQLDLGRALAVKKIRLLVEQSPNGSTTHKLYGGLDPNTPPTTPFKTLSASTTNNTWIEYDCGQDRNCGNIRYLRIVTTAGNSWVAWKEIEVYQGTEYFGYFADGCQELTVDPTMNEGANIPYTAKAGANMHMVSVSPPSPSFDAGRWQTAVQQSVASGGKAALSLIAELFLQNCCDGNGNVDPTHPPVAGSCGSLPRCFRLRSDWQPQRNAILDFVNSSAVAGSIAALYPLDEPYNNGANANELQSLCSSIHSGVTGHPGTKLPIAAILQITEFYDQDKATVTATLGMFDWLGFDCYEPWSVGCRGHSVPDQISMLKSKIASTQRLIAVPPAYPGDDNSMPNELDMIDSINNWHQEVIADPAYVAVIPFRWGTLAVGDVPVYPSVKQRYVQFAENILGAPFSKPAQAGASFAHPSYPASNAIDGDSTTFYSSPYAPTSKNDSGFLLAVWQDQPQLVDSLILTPRMYNGQVMAFPPAYNVYIDNLNVSPPQWYLVGQFTAQPVPGGSARVLLGADYNTDGVVIVPTQLGVDNYGGHYFQMAEVRLANTRPVFNYSMAAGGAYSNNVLNSSWAAANVVDGSVASSYSSGFFASASNDSQAALYAWEDARLINHKVNTVVLTARMLNGVSQAFPLSYLVYVENEAINNWNLVGTFSSQPSQASSVVVVPLGGDYLTRGIGIVPTTLGTDIYGSHYFQMAEVQVGLR